MLISRLFTSLSVYQREKYSPRNHEGKRRKIREFIGNKSGRRMLININDFLTTYRGGTV